MTSYSPPLQEVLQREPEPPGGITGVPVDYQVDGTACQGYVATPADGAAARPAVLVVHDWLGVTDAVRMRCDMLARVGYLAFAADVYGADVRPGPAEAPRVAGSYYGDQKLWRARVSGAFDRMLAEPGTDAARTAAIGYCFGGSSVLQLARTGADVHGVVSFHGRLSAGPPGESDAIRAKLLVLHGALDPVTPDEAVAAFEHELRATAGLDWQMVIYSGAMHAFAVPGTDAPDHGAQYDETADRRSWTAMKGFLAEALGPA